MTLLEEKELVLIENGLSFDCEAKRWSASYPWIRDPEFLPNNKYVACATLKSTEKRLSKNPLHAKLYQGQIHDMLDRKAARRVNEEELKAYKGPKFYISHHDVLKPESNSTAMRIVFNSSAKVKGVSLNDFLAKGPSLLNNILGVLLRFRQDRFAFICDISKMFHSISTPIREQMTHLFLWRDFNTEIKPETYAITAVNMGDRPASAIAQSALRKTAEEAKDTYPEASKIILENSYMDDIPGSVSSEEEGNKVMNDIAFILDERGFKIKEWQVTGQSNVKERTEIQHAVQKLLDKDEAEQLGKVLGMEWDTVDDTIKYSAKRVNMIHRETTKRECLSTIYSLYDPLGLLTPLILKAKILRGKCGQRKWTGMKNCPAVCKMSGTRSRKYFRL